jgi:hypothetical protein
MEFTVPQFIEKEAKIVGPLTFKQFAFFGVAVGFCVFLWFVLPSIVFFIVAIPLVVGAGVLAFYKKEGIPIPNLIGSWFLFIFKPKIYLWKKKGVAPKFFKLDKKKREIAREIEEEPIQKKSSLKMHRGSNLNKLSTQVETKE